MLPKEDFKELVWYGLLGEMMHDALYLWGRLLERAWWQAKAEGKAEAGDVETVRRVAFIAGFSSGYDAGKAQADGQFVNVTERAQRAWEREQEFDRREAGDDAAWQREELAQLSAAIKAELAEGQP